MDIILNEKKYAEYALKDMELGSKPSSTLNILARYYREQGLTDDEIFIKLDKFLKACLKSDYNSAKWIECVNYQIKNSKKYQLIKIDKISVTQKEINTIENTLIHPRIRRLAFTLLVLAKYHNQINDKNNGWVNEPHKRIFKLASITTTQNNQPLMINTLISAGLVKTSKRVDNVNLCVTFIDDNSDVVIEVDDMRELGKEYMLYCNENYIRCERCGILFKPNIHNQKYCIRCKGYVKQETKVVECCDCGIEFEVDSKDNVTTRCSHCYQKYRRSKVNDNVKRHRERKKHNM